MSELLVASFLDDQDAVIGSSFEKGKLPLHLTFVPWFTIKENNIGDLNSALSSIIGSHPFIDAKADSRDMFGPNNEVQVTRVADNGELLELHVALLGLVLPLTISPPHSEYIGRTYYHPHVSDLGESCLEVGGCVQLKGASVIIKDPHDDSRTVIAHHSFKDGI